MDLYRISSLSVESINYNKYKGVVGIQVIGLHLTFYVSTLLAKDFYAMLEICSIALPKDLSETMSYFANINNLLPVLQCYKNSLILLHDMPTDSRIDIFDALKIAEKSKNRKRKCPIVLNH